MQKRFGELEKEFTLLEKSRIAILPVIYDGTSTWGKGADKGPFAILEASEALELYDIETRSEVYRKGIYTSSPLEGYISPEDMVRDVESKTSNLIESGKFVVLLGGEHSVSIGSINAHAKKFDDFCILQLDAHSDLRDEYKGSKNNHACVMARAKEIAPVVQVGVRSMDLEETTSFEKENMFFAKDIIAKEEWIDEVVERLNKNVYITIDLDVFDPSIMSSTGTPEPGGLDWYKVLKLINKVSEERNIVGFDVVELCPIEINKAPDFLAAKLVYKILGYVGKNWEGE